MRKALYPGSFDPITNGHLDIIRRAAQMTDELTVAIGVNADKKRLFTAKESERLIQAAVAGLPNVTVDSYSGLLVQYAYERGIAHVVRGIRNLKDFEDEQSLELFNASQNLSLEGVYLRARTDRTHVSSTMLKNAMREQADIRSLAPLATIQAVQARLAHQYPLAVTGPAGAGKTSLIRRFAAIAQTRGIPLHHIDVDAIVADILETRTEPVYASVRAQIAATFGESLMLDGGAIDRRELGRQAMSELAKLQELNRILAPALQTRLSRALYGIRGIVLIDSSVIAETGENRLCNNHFLLVEADRDVIEDRLRAEGELTSSQIQRRVRSALTAEAKARTIEKLIAEDGFGRLLRIDNTRTLPDAAVEAVFETILQTVDIYGELRIAGYLKTLGAADPQGSYEDLRSRYSEPHRYYHALFHIVDGLAQLPEALAEADDPSALMAAWLLHDAVYDARADDNEARSAQLAAAMGPRWGLSPAQVARAQGLILATRHREPPDSPDAERLVDIDLSTLGREPAAFAEYDRDVRREYAHLTEQRWRRGRRAVLQQFLGRGRLYWQPRWQERFQAQAERNLQGALARLEDTAEVPGDAMV